MVKIVLSSECEKSTLSGMEGRLPK